jgi:amino acid adenylation domain-containing protein
MNNARSVDSGYTIEEVIALARRANAREGGLRPLSRVDRGELLAASYAQQRLWFLAQLEGVSEAYHIWFNLRLRGRLNEIALSRTLDRIVARHETLRTSFYTVDGALFQRIADENVGFTLDRRDLSRGNDLEEQLSEEIEREAFAPFDLAHGPLIRGRLLRLGDNDHALLITMHHIASDGWSAALFAHELSVLYQANVRGVADALAALPLQYADYAAWQRECLSGSGLAEQADYWRRALSGIPAVIELPTDKARPAQQDYAGDAVSLAFDETLTTDLKSFSRRRGLTLFMTILSGWALVLSRLAGQEDVVIGVPSANRNRLEIEGLIGFFVNTLALRIDLSGQPTLHDLIERVRAVVQGAQAHQDIPFEQVVDILRPARSLSHAPLFQVMFAWEDYESPVLNLPDLAVSKIKRLGEPAIFDLLLNLWEEKGRITGRLGYATSLFDRETVERYADYLRRALSSIVRDTSQITATTPLLSPAEEYQLLVEWNLTQKDFPSELCVHQLFESQVSLSSDARALVFEGNSLTYRELNARANKLAHHLRSLGVGPDSMVAICAERSLEMVVGLIATLKAGGTYVPLDPAYPSERLAHMIEDSSPLVVLTNGGTHEKLWLIFDQFHIRVQTINLSTDEKLWSEHPGVDIDPAVIGLKPKHLCYIIYTSGSTGKPKGVMMPHIALVNLLAWHRAEATGACTLQFTSLGFDVSFQEIFSTLISGGVLVLIPDKVRYDLGANLALLRSSGVQSVFAPQIVVEHLAQALTKAPIFSLQNIFQAGEALKITPAIAGLMAETPGLALYNHYGPTETHVATSFKVNPPSSRVFPPIGRPIFNARIYLLDKFRRPIPRGVIGEIYIGGIGVARGYLNRPDLTSERFFDSPFVPGDRLYKTGDLARYLPDGNIEYLGRNDFQVKIRGFRIELGEIETNLSAHPLVREGIVVARERAGGDKQLVGYYTTASEIDPGADELRTHLSSTLPEYMVPAAYVRLSSLPLTRNGKLDRNALPAARENAYSRRNYEQPVSPIETALAQIWSEVLGIERVGRNDNFFSLGGHSLLAIRLLERMRERFKQEFPVRIMFEDASLLGISKHIHHLESNISHLPIDSHSPVIQFRDGTEEPIFLIHAMGGGIFCFQGLVNSMNKNIPLYGIHAHALELKKAVTFEGIASIYLKHIMHIQPKGPFRILGYSLGATIANLIATKLITMGHQVSTLIFLDLPLVRSYSPGTSKQEKWHSFAKVLLGYERYCGVKDGISFSAGSEKYAFLQRALNDGSKNRFDLRYVRNTYGVWRRHVRALTAFAPFTGTYLSKVVLYKPTLRCEADTADRIAMFKGRWINSEIVELHADHETIMEAPAINAIGSDLNARLAII